MHFLETKMPRFFSSVAGTWKASASILFFIDSYMDILIEN